jgi:hypothetical protein
MIPSQEWEPRWSIVDRDDESKIGETDPSAVLGEEIEAEAKGVVPTEFLDLRGGDRLQDPVSF